MFFNIWYTSVLKNLRLTHGIRICVLHPLRSLIFIYFKQCIKFVVVNRYVFNEHFGKTFFFSKLMLYVRYLTGTQYKGLTMFHFFFEEFQSSMNAKLTQKIKLIITYIIKRLYLYDFRLWPMLNTFSWCIDWCFVCYINDYLSLLGRRKSLNISYIQVCLTLAIIITYKS